MTIKQKLEKQWNGHQRMVNHCLKEHVYAQLNDRHIHVMNKPRIESNMYYQDIDYYTGEMAKAPSKKFDSFRAYNMRQFEILLDHFNNRDVVVIDHGFGITGWSTKYHSEAMREDFRLATDQEIETIKQALNEEIEKYEKRLKTYYKRYADKITTTSYWADR